MAGKSERDRGNFVSEWFGHRVHPRVISNPKALEDQKGKRCPFLTDAKGEDTECIKAEASKGVCTISSVSNLARQDWLACPYRAIGPQLLNEAVSRLYALPKSSALVVLPAIRLKDASERESVTKSVEKGGRVFIYFDARLGGELSIPATAKSPELSFDITIVEIVSTNGVMGLGRFGVLEIQTMDFHGSYRSAVKNLVDGLRLHGAKFAKNLQEHQEWLAEGVEGPNIANVFKRTFYQMMFKFQLGPNASCAGCILAIPTSVWDSWQKHLASPTLSDEGDGVSGLFRPGAVKPKEVPAWIFVFDTDKTGSNTPAPLVFDRIIATDAPSVSYFALDEAPREALKTVLTEEGFFGLMSRRLRAIWPELVARPAVKTTKSGKKA